MSLERMVRGQWRPSDSDLGLAFIWREESGDYTARYEVPARSRRAPPAAGALGGLRPESRPFTVRRSQGVEAPRRPRGGGSGSSSSRRTRRPTPSARSSGARPSAWGGKAVLRVGKRRLKAQLAPAPARVGRPDAAARAQKGGGSGCCARGHLRQPDRRPARVRLGALAPLDLAAQHRHGRRPHAGSARRR